jgi:thiamine-phosphate pyrophosphorylase
LRSSEKVRRACFRGELPVACYITDRKTLPGVSLLACVRWASDWGVQLIQIREKDLCDRALYALTGRVVRLTESTGCRIVVNGRADIALAAGAHGVHLPSQGPDPRALRRWLPPDFIIGVSTHSAAEARDAAASGADYVLLGPVFKTESKRGMGRPLGLSRLRRACALVPVPVIALGGIRPDNVRAVLDAGAAGIAGIRIFQVELPRLGVSRSSLLARPGARDSRC